MGIYIKAKLISESDTHVMYRYGFTQENMDALLKMDKYSFEIVRIIDNHEYPHDLPSVMIASRIVKYYKIHNCFPSEITKQTWLWF